MPINKSKPFGSQVFSNPFNDEDRPFNDNPTPPSGAGAMLLESGSYMLLESGDRMLLE